MSDDRRAPSAEQFRVNFLYARLVMLFDEMARDALVGVACDLLSALDITSELKIYAAQGIIPEQSLADDLKASMDNDDDSLDSDELCIRYFGTESHEEDLIAFLKGFNPTGRAN